MEIVRAEEDRGRLVIAVMPRVGPTPLDPEVGVVRVGLYEKRVMDRGAVGGRLVPKRPGHHESQLGVGPARENALEDRHRRRGIPGGEEREAELTPCV